MKKAAAKVLGSVLINPIAFISTILLGAIVCVGNSPIEAKTGRPFLAATARPSAQNPEVSRQHSDEWETLTMRVTGYCPCRRCCGRFADGKTACGYRIRWGDVFVAADKRYPFGTEMIVPGYNSAKPVEVLDRGFRIYGNRLDVFFHSHAQALEWGVKYLHVKVRRNPKK